MNNWIVIEYLINFMEVSIIFYFIMIVLGRTDATFKKAILPIIIQALFNSYANYTFGIASLMGLTLILISLGIMHFILLRENIFTIYLLIILAILVNSLIELLVANLLIFIPRINPQLFYRYTIYRFIGVILSKFTLFMLIKYGISKLNISKYLDNTGLYQLYLLFIPNIIIIFVALWFYKYAHAIDMPFKLYITIITS